MDKMLNADFWNNRYKNDNTPWNIGHTSPPIQQYIDKIEDKNICILIPGAGHAHEAIYLKKKGFTNVFVCDWAPESFQNLDRIYPDFPENHKVVSDFFELELAVDLILEQTFFCAIQPDLRPAYAKKTSELLSKGGRLAGLLFAENFDKPGPPFGGTKAEYVKYFKPYFHIISMERSEYSIDPRLGRELFIELEKK